MVVVRRIAWRVISLLLLGALLVLALFPSIQGPWERSIPMPAEVELSHLYAGAIVIGLAAVVFGWRSTRFFVTLIHELGHSTAAALLGGHPLKITMARDSSGLATSRYSGSSWFVGSVVSLAGYLAPGIACLGGAAAIEAGNSYLWLLLTGSFLIIILIGLARSFTVMFVTAVVIAVVGSVVWWWPWAAPAVAGVLIAIWGLGGVRSAREQFGDLGRMTAAGGDLLLCDSENVQRLTHVPARLVATGQLLGAFGLAAVSMWIAFPR